MRILFVENHAGFARIVIQEFLRQHEIRITAAIADARILLANSRFDLVLSDYDLDDGKGDELVREMAVHFSALPVIAVSSHDRGNAALVAAGAVAVCSKMEFHRIQNVIDEVFRNRPPP